MGSAYHVMQKFIPGPVLVHEIFADPFGHENCHDDCIRIYYVGLNTLFASVLPLALLLFLNVRTAAELFKMGNTDTAADPRGEFTELPPIFTG